MKDIIRINSLKQLHSMLGFKAPKHPLVTVFKMRDLPMNGEFHGVKFLSELYLVSLKQGMQGSIVYGQNSYDFSDGTMIFMKPNQVLEGNEKEITDEADGWMLAFHPDLIRRSELAQNIHQYSFFDYEVHEALHLSEEEQESVTELIHKIEKEYERPIDQHSQKLIVANIQLLLDYCTRYYDRQFYVRTNLNQDRVGDFEHLLQAYFSSDKPAELGLPTVKYCGEQLHMSPNYLSDLLKRETGQSAKEHINNFVIDRAKNQLLGTTNAISEIAFGLGFEYPQHFSKLFKAKTGMSPLKYRTQN